MIGIPQTSPEELLRLAQSNNKDDREFAAVQAETGEDILSVLINDPEEQVRVAVAQRGFGLDRLMYDERVWVRVTVAEQGYGLEQLACDKDPYVRNAVARQGAMLHQLINDPDENVRASVANNGYGLDKLIQDDAYQVRCSVASKGFGLDILINDEDGAVREEVAKQNYRLDVLINDPNPSVREQVARQCYGLDKLLHDPFPSVRAAVAQQGYGLDVLKNDPDDYVVQVVNSYLQNHPSYKVAVIIDEEVNKSTPKRAAEISSALSDTAYQLVSSMEKNGVELPESVTVSLDFFIINDKQYFHKDTQKPVFAPKLKIKNGDEEITLYASDDIKNGIQFINIAAKQWENNQLHVYKMNEISSAPLTQATVNIIDYIAAADIVHFPKRTPHEKQYSVRAYFGKSPSGDFVALDDDTNTSDWLKVEEFAHASLMKGDYVIITDTESGNDIRIDPSVYSAEFDGEFPYKPEDLCVASNLNNTVKTSKPKTEYIDD